MDPTILVRRFAAGLGWNGIERTDITLTPKTCDNLPVGTIITDWTTSNLIFFIQINQWSPGRFGTYNVSVVAERYGIAPVDFTVCAFETAEEADKESQRLAPLLARKNFKDKKWRRRYLEQHPQKLFRSKKKRRGWKGRLA